MIGASLLFLSKMYRRAAPPNLFLGRRSTPPSFHRSSDAGVGSSGSGLCGASSNLKDSRDKCSQEPLLIYRSGTASASNGSVAQLQPATLRTVHQDVCTCPHPQPPPPPPPPLQTTDHLQDRLSKLPKNLGRRIALKLGLHTIQWKRNPITDFFSSSALESPVSPVHPGGPYISQNSHCQLKQSTSNPGYPFDMEWDPADYWNAGCLGSCNHLAIDGDCNLCHSCADCGLPLDDEDYIDDECQIHSSMHLPDAVDIPELPPEVFLAISYYVFLSNKNWWLIYYYVGWWELV